MNQRDKIIIQSILEKANRLCPGALDLLGIYGSAATGDIHEKSDLDLLLLINDERGQRLAECFLLDDCGIGYDLYCTTWEMLEEDALCHHPHIAKLMDSEIVWVRNVSVHNRLDTLREQSAQLLASNLRFDRATANLQQAKVAFADCCLAHALPEIRACAGGVIHYLLNALMLYHGRYFRKGVKRTFQELEELKQPFDLQALILDVIRAETADSVRSGLHTLITTVSQILLSPGAREPANASTIRGTYEEMFSNWRNKMYEAAENDDLFSSFMNAVSCRYMLTEISKAIEIPKTELLEGFDPDNLDRNAQHFDKALETYLLAYSAAGIQPKQYANVEAFAAAYMQDTKTS